MMNFDWQAAFALVMLAAMGVALFGQARRNPVGTGHVLRKQDEMNARLTAVEQRIEDEIKGLATKADLERLAGDVKAVKAEVSGVAGHTESIDQAVVRIEQFLIHGGPVAGAAAPKKTRRTS